MVNNSNKVSHVPEFNFKIKKAVDNLKKLESITVTKAGTSHYMYGMKESCIRDRFDVSILTGEDQNVYCQIVFDSSDYSLSPDLIFKKSTSHLIRGFEELNKLLPNSSWDLNDENCLYDWFTHILEKRERWCIYATKEKERDDSFQNIFEDKSSKKFDLTEKSTNQMKKIKEKDVADNIPDAKSVKSFPIFNKGKRKANVSDEDLGDFESKAPTKVPKLDTTTIDTIPVDRMTTEEMRDFRQKFSLFWMNKYRDHIIQYDSVNFKKLSLYMTFDIPPDSPMWGEYIDAKSVSYANFVSRTRNKAKIPKQKPLAPMIVHFYMKNTFPYSKLRIRLISVINTTEAESSYPDTVDVDYEIDLSKKMHDLTRSVKQYIREIAIKFHLKQSL